MAQNSIKTDPSSTTPLPVVWRLRFSFLLLALPFLGCSSASYLWKQIPGHLSLMQGHVEIETLLADADTTPILKKNLSLALQAQSYAINVIGLKKSRNYTRYKDLKRDFVVIAVTASPKLELKPHEWKFPFFGAFPYLGFFEEADARAEKERLEKEGYDTSIRKVRAFSSLGWFRDPVTNTMLESPAHLVETILHEMTHTTVYHKNEAEFNEALALVVGQEGALAFLDTLADADWPEKKKWKQEFVASLERSRKLSRWLTEAKQRTTALYTNNALSDAQKLERRPQLFQSLEKRWKETLGDKAAPPVNNAFLVSLGTYIDLADKLRTKWRSHPSLRDFVHWAATPEALQRQ